MAYFVLGDPSNALRYAVHTHELEKPLQCEVCGKRCGSRQIHGHHFDYHEYYKIIWVCHQCHKDIHTGKLDLIVDYLLYDADIVDPDGKDEPWDWNEPEYRIDDD
jgi:hypothetical protein